MWSARDAVLCGAGSNSRGSSLRLDRRYARLANASIPERKEKAFGMESYGRATAGLRQGYGRAMESKKRSGVRGQCPNAQRKI